MYKLEFRDKAAKEYEEAYEWYEEQLIGLGDKFEKAVDEKLNKILNNPLHYKKTTKRYHEATLDKFPFIIAYSVNDNENYILIMAIFHTSCNPKFKYKK